MNIKHIILDLLLEKEKDSKKTIRQPKQHNTSHKVIWKNVVMKLNNAKTDDSI